MSKNQQAKLQDQLQDQSLSAFERYKLLAVGSSSIWYLIKYELIMMFVAPLPGALGFVLRKWLFPCILGSVGKGVIFGRGITIRHGLKVHIGNKATIDDYVVLDAKGDSNQGIRVGDATIISRNTVLSCKGADITIGSECTLGINSIVHAREGSPVLVKDHVLCGAYCYLIGGGPFVTDELDTPFKQQGMTSKGGVLIEQNVWLGSGVHVMDGVTIATGSIVGSHAMVNKDIDAYSISAGVPAKKMKSRK